MLEIKYQLSVPGHAGVFCEMIRQFNNSNDSMYMALIPNLYDFQKSTIYLNMSSLTLFSAILKYNEKNPVDNILFNRVFLKCKELANCYLVLSDYGNAERNEGV